MKYLVIFSTVPDHETGLKISENLIKEKLAACCNLVPGLLSVFSWKGKIQHDSEELLIIKSTEKEYEAIEKRIKDLHPYQIPEIIALPLARGSDSYLNWINQETGVADVN